MQVCVSRTIPLHCNQQDTCMRWCTKAEQAPVGGHVPNHLQQEPHIGSSGEFLIELVAAVCELNVHIQLHQTAHLQYMNSMAHINMKGRGAYSSKRLVSSKSSFDVIMSGS